MAGRCRGGWCFGTNSWTSVYAKMAMEILKPAALSGSHYPVAALVIGAKSDRRSACAITVYDHVHLRSPDPDATARFFETMFGAEVTRRVYPPGTLYPGQQRITVRLGGQTVLIAPPHPHEPNAMAPSFPHYGLEHIGLTVDDVDATVEELRAKAAEIAIGPLTRNPGLRLAFIRGPEGIMIELVQR